MTAATPTLQLKRGKDRSLRRRHPWIFSGAVARVEGSPAAGDTVLVRTHEGEPLALAGYSPASQIRARVWTFDTEEEVGPALLARRLERAVNARRCAGLLDQDAAPHGACRLVNAESDGLPGVVVDRYGDHLVWQLTFAGAELWREALAVALGQCLPGAAGIFERSDAAERQKEGLEPRCGVVQGAEPPELLVIQEGSCRYHVDVRRGHKTGFYLDQRESRAAVAALAGGAELLNAFCYTGGFGVAALRAGAASVLNLDSSASALELARRNAALNGLPAHRFETVEEDAFAALRRLHQEGRRFDLVVLDPPKFVKGRKALNRAARGYKDINLHGFRLLRPGGRLITFSCSGLLPPDLHQKIVADAALDAGVEAQLVGRLGPGPDHPVALPFPEGSYLKGLVCRVG